MKLRSYLMLSLLFTGLICLSCKNAEDTEKAASDDAEIRLEDHSEYDNVQAAISDYLLGLYEVDSTKIDKSVDTTLRKVGYYFDGDNNVYRDNLEMTFEQLSSLAARWNKEGNRVDDESPRKIEIYDILDKTASAKLTAEWGVDYFHLAKVNDQWKIMNVIWQSHPK